MTRYNEEEMSNANETLTSSASSVTDANGGVWYPSEEAQAEIDASSDASATCMHICTSEPMRGEWHS